MLHRARGFAFRLTGLILGIIGTVVSVTAIVFSTIGLVKAAHCSRER
jgi:5,10-methenyltetrahydromethanopterin hydrogenase